MVATKEGTDVGEREIGEGTNEIHTHVTGVDNVGLSAVSLDGVGRDIKPLLYQ